MTVQIDGYVGAKRKSFNNNIGNNDAPKRNAHPGQIKNNVYLNGWSMFKGYVFWSFQWIIVICAVGMACSTIITGSPFSLLLFPRHSNVKQPIIERELILTPEQLAAFDGSDTEKPIYLAIKGQIFDVSAGKNYYGKEGSYSIFSGRDASRAFITGCFVDDHLTGDLRGLTEDQIKSLDSWVDFYHNHKHYFYVGKVLNPDWSETPIPSTNCKNSNK